jgi:hypothetical protein
MASYRVEEWLRRLRTLLEHTTGVRVEVEQVPQIPTKASGKFRYVISRVADQTGAQSSRDSA